MASIRKRTLPSRKIAWQCDFKDANGRRISRQFKTRRQADAFMVQARAQVSRGTFVHDRDSATVAEAAQIWLQKCAERRDQGRRMEMATWVGYESHVRLHICAADVGIGSITLTRVTRKVVNDFRDRLLATGRSEITTRKILSSLSLVIGMAQEDGFVAQNPAKSVKVFRTSRMRKHITVPSKDEIRSLLDAAPEGFRSYLIVAALCGLRASEQRALRWQEVDFRANVIHIRRRADAAGVIGEPKTQAGHRSVPVGPLVSNVLKRWRAVGPPSPRDLVFPTKRGGIQSHANVLHRWFYPLLRSVGVKYRWHDLRHFAVSLWIEQGFPPKVIMEFAGHSSITMTYDLYGHLFPSPDHQEGMAEIERRLLG